MLLPQYASAAKRPNREAGVSPAQSRYCEGEFTAIEPLSRKSLRRSGQTKNQSQETCQFLTSK